MAKILLVEDNPVDIEMTRSCLEKRGHKIVLANNGKEGINRAISDMPDLILMDMVLPGMHGLEAAMKIKKFPKTKDIPIIALTAVGGSDFIKECYDEGICAFIHKPYNPIELVSKMEKFLARQKKPVKKILIINGEPAVATMITMSLMRQGYNVITASDGRRDMEQAFNAKPDLILLDDSFSEESASYLTEQLKKLDKKKSIPLILMTDQSAEKKIKKKATRWRAKDFLTKPVTCKEVINAVNKILID